MDVDISGGVSMGKTFADFYSIRKKPANMKIALGVRAQRFYGAVFGEDGNALAFNARRNVVGSLMFSRNKIA